MKLRGLLAGLVLIALANAAVLAGVAWNRRGEPEATVILTERELQIPWSAVNDEDDTGLDLQLEWNARWAAGGRAPEGLPLTTLHELGFQPRAGRNEPPRTAWVVMEMDGEAWQRWIAKRRRQVEEERRKEPESDCPPGADLEQMLVSGSRLVVVDAGRDPEALRRRHPDRSRYLVVPGTVHAREASPGAFEGLVSELRVNSIHVPLRLRPLLDEIVTAERVRRETSTAVDVPPRPPRYRATVAFGKRGEPWLVNVEKLSAPATPPAGFASAPPPAPPGGCSG
ncbi:MAG TPA: DUF4824 family protein [Thermoanaerobaculia bacterium]|jgi:hypothetical protein|nr:DUF4824 family protein [Thermoanaerobaculia bacterium]